MPGFQLILAIALVAIGAWYMYIDTRPQNDLMLRQSNHNQHVGLVFFALAVALVISSGFLMRLG